ncbi:peptidoglycan DD-metalloendopeptidase family protein [Patescibacteria group bacterium]|nr:peptidoglycan DD-metalloendopeptidase family protein [Patescibacteria group bacterium]
MARVCLKIIAKQLLLLIILATFLLGSQVVFAQTESGEEVDSGESIDALQDEIADRKSAIERINSKIEEYRAEIRKYTSQTANLVSDIAMIENQIAIAQLDVDAIQIEIEQQQLEVQILTEKIRQESEHLTQQREMLKEMIFTLHRRSRIGILEILFGSNDFSELFTEIEQLESVNADLNRALEATKKSKENIENNKAKQEEHLDGLIDLEVELEQRVVGMEYQIGAKNKLVQETQESEAQYRVLMSELRQERQNVTSQIVELQSEIEDRLAEADDLGDPSLMSWPLDGIMTAYYHDPTYPFRNLWEHSGIDLAAPTGTPITAASPGIVAWTRTGRSYGNYVMIIHQGGFATLYAHLSRFGVNTDEFVARGQVIGYVGSTGFSTGPHLHFEVRLNGIPVDPTLYLVN